MTKLPQSEWMDAREAVNLLAPVVGGDAAAKAMIADRLRDGVLKASAGYLVEGADIGPIQTVFTDRQRQILRQQATKNDGIQANKITIESNFPKISQTSIGSEYAYLARSPELDRMIIGGAVWAFSTDWKKDLSRWDWGTGTFVFSCPAAISSNSLKATIPLEFRYPKRIVIYGVELKRSEMEAIARSFVANSPLTPSTIDERPVVKRTRASKHDWAAVLRDLVAISHVQGLDKAFNIPFGDKGWQKNLEDWISQHFINRNLDCGESVVRKQAKEVIEAIENQQHRAP